ncbi:MAG: tyrosine--tRNA ligase [Desulfurococcaceae archaeon]
MTGEVQEKLKVATRNTVEVVTVEELSNLLLEGEKPRGYLGFEPSGLVHVGWLVWMLKVKDLVELGVDFYILEATWHAYINDKLGGDLELIRKAARYTRRVLEALGVPETRVKYVDAEDLVSDEKYWEILIKSAKKTSLARVKRALTIMGRTADEAETDFSKLIYPLMQVTDIFYLDLDIVLGGIDQRKAHMLARDLAEKLGFKKPVAIHTPLITSLRGPARKQLPQVEKTPEFELDDVASEVKMSKSKPETAIFLHDPPDVVRAKVMNAYCPPRTVLFNPVVEINKYLLFQQPGFILHIDRPSKYGGPIDVYSADELEALYIKGEVHPLDLKNATADALVNMLRDIQAKLFSSRETVKLIEELKQARITR